MLSPVYLAYLMDVKSCQVSISDKRFLLMPRRVGDFLEYRAPR